MLRKGGQFFMSTFFRQEELYVTEDELEKTYNYIKNMMDSKISQIQKVLVEMQQRIQQKEQIEHSDVKQQIEIKQQMLDINAMLSLMDQEITKLNKKIELLRQDMPNSKNQPTSSLDITMQLEQMTQQTTKEQTEFLKEQIEQLEKTINLQDDNLSEIRNEINQQEQKLLELKNIISEGSTKQNVKSIEGLKKLQEQIDLQIDIMKTEIRESVEEKLFEQNVEVQKVEQLLTLKMNKSSEETRNTREEIEKTKLKIEEILLEWKNNENNKVTHYEIEQINQKLLQIDNALKNNQTRREIEELIEKKTKIKQEELESQFKLEKEQLEEQLQIVKNEFEKKIKMAENEFNQELKMKIEELEKQKKEEKEEMEKQNEEKIRKIVEEMLANQRKEQLKNEKEILKETTQISQILATIK